MKFSTQHNGAHDEKLDLSHQTPIPFRRQLLEMKKNFRLIFVPPFLLMNSNEQEPNRGEKSTSRRSFLKKLNHPIPKLGLFLIFIVLTWVAFPQWFTMFPFKEFTEADFTRPENQPPCDLHILGTTTLGRDVFARLIWGARTSIILSMFTSIFSLLVGCILGLTAAYFGKFWDSIVMRANDIILAFPGLIILLVAVTAYGLSMTVILITMAIFNIPTYCRLLRPMVFQEKSKTYVEAAIVSGSSPLEVMIKHILPNCMGPLIVEFTFQIGGNILGLTALSFLGFGAENVVDWGADIALSQAKFYMAPWAAFVPGIGILITVLGFMLVGDGLRDALDPRYAY